MGRDFDQLHIRHDRRPQGCGLSSSRGVFAGAGQCPDDIHGQARGLPVDFAHVPLQRLVLSVDAQRDCRHARLLAAGSGGADLVGFGPGRRHALVRRADRHVAADFRARSGPAPFVPNRAVLHRRRSPEEMPFIQGPLEHFQLILKSRDLANLYHLDRKMNRSEKALQH